MFNLCYGIVEVVCKLSANARAVLAHTAYPKGKPGKSRMRTRYVLSIDGGGVRGIVAAVLLDALEGELQKAGHKTALSDCFDVIAGTSTGAIIAAALALPATDDENAQLLRNPSGLRDLYRSRSHLIFPPRALPFIPVIGRLRQLFGPLYSPRPLKNLLDSAFGDASFINPRRNLVITAYSIDPRDAIFFRGGPQTPPGDSLCSGSIRIADAVLGSSSAPTFFPPHQAVNPRTGTKQTLIDGAVFINDPSLAGFSEALRIYPDDDIRVISIGTGRIVQPIPFAQARKWGFLEWVTPAGQFRTPLLSAIADGQARAVNSHLKKLIGERYQRFDYDLTRGYGSPSIDDSRPSNIKALERGALKMAEEMRPRLREVAKELVITKARNEVSADHRKRTL